MGGVEHAHAVHHRLGLGDLVVAAGEGDRLPFTAGGPQHLVDPLAVVCDQGVGRLQDRGGGAVVLLQLHHRAGGLIGSTIAEVVLEAHQDREVGGAEAVDALVGVAHHEHRATVPVVEGFGVAAVGDQQLDQVVLGAVGVLVFVHQHVTETPVPVVAHLLMLAQQLHRQQQQVVEVEGVVGGQGTAVEPVGLRLLAAAHSLRLRFQLIRQPALVLGVADRPAHLLGLEALGIETQLLGHDLFHQALGIPLVVDRELARPAQALRVLELVDVEAQQPGEQGVEGADPEVLDHLAVDARAQLALLHRRQGAPGLAELALGQLLGQQQLQPLLHLAGGLVGEGHRQQLGRIHAVVAHQVGDAVGERPGLAAAGPGHHQQGPGVMVHRPALGVVEAGKECTHGLDPRQGGGPDPRAGACSSVAASAGPAAPAATAPAGEPSRPGGDRGGR